MPRKPRVLYLSGAIQSDPDYQRRFARGQERLESVGYVVLNPAQAFGGYEFLPREVYIKRDLMEIITVADGLAMLPTWERSPGARLEAEVARQCGLPVNSLDHWIGHAPTGRCQFTLEMFDG